MKARDMHHTQIERVGANGHLRCEIDEEGHKLFFAAADLHQTEFEVDEGAADMILSAKEVLDRYVDADANERRNSFQNHLEAITGRKVSVFNLSDFQYATFESYPVKAYVFGEDGMHDGALWLNNDTELGDFLADEVMACVNSGKGEIRVTDMGDMLLYRVEQGYVVYNGLKGGDQDS